MFRTGSPYSPFFTSGFLSEPLSSPDPFLGPRRGSLPTDSPPTLSTDESSAFYFTLQPQRDESEFRSFLSLDLAESQSLRSASLRRKMSKATTPFACVIPSSIFFSYSLLSSTIPEARKHHPAPLRIRMSRDSFRTIPSPKPAPSTTLPDLPKQPSSSSSSSPISHTPPRLPTLTFSTSLGLSLERASHSAPSLVVSRTSTPDIVHKLPKRFSTMTTSSISTRARKSNRSDALARLEGRSKPSNLPVPNLSTNQKQKQKQNFMCMSDDEDDFDLDCFLVREEEPEDIVLPIIPSDVNNAPVGRMLSSLASFRSSGLEPQHPTKDWFPLKSFIDLHNDDDVSAWSWRSWIEVASVS
jgi:hypothetical protein